MSHEFLIDIAPNGAALRLNLRSKQPGVPEAGKPFNREQPDISAESLSKLRSGSAPLPVVDDVAARLSIWLLGSDLQQDLNAVLDQPAGEPVRIVLSVNDEDLREKLSDLPFELCSLSGGAVVPLALNRRVASIVHLLPKVGTPPAAPNAGVWPLRVLVVRSNPLDLGGGVPAAATIRASIYDIIDRHPKLRRDLVQVHVLSGEQAADLAGPPTLERLLRQLQKMDYDILIYLGHGDVSQIPGRMPVGVLQLEAEGGEVHVPVPVDQLTMLFHQRPVPVVILAGCLTASEVDADLREDVERNIPQWMKGSQAVAQALINSESGVQFAVGMRYKLDTSDAQRFLLGFFKSFFSDEPGHVEAAVRAARQTLKLGPANSYSWSAPVLFRSLGLEPMFPHLAAPPEAVYPNVEQQTSLRSIFWEMLSKIPWKMRGTPQGGVELIKGQLDSADQQYVQTFAAQGLPLLMPGRVEATQEGSEVVPLELYGNLSAAALRGDVVFGSDQLKVTSIKATPELLAAGFQVLSLAAGSQASFYIERTEGGDLRRLPEGRLLEISVALGTAYQLVCPVNVGVRKIEPGGLLCAGNNAVIIPPP
ncbi:MAG TPA: CHAT domain-containing protein [Pyrinomonadaceae bacterium]